MTEVSQDEHGSLVGRGLEIDVEYDFQYHYIMLSCKSRMTAFKDGIFDGDLLKDKVVADIGSGTGILALWCAQAGAKRVYAIEPNNNYKIIEESAKRNGLQDIIKVYHATAEEVELPEKVDAIVSEILGAALIGDAIFPFLVQAREKFLKEDGLMLPCKSSLLFAPIEDDDYFVRGENMFNHFKSIYGLDLCHLTETFRKSCSKKVYSKQIRQTCLRAAPQIIQTFDFNTLTVDKSTKCEGDFQYVIQSETTKFNGFTIWFDTHFPNNVKFTTGPLGHQTHWGQCVLYLENSIELKKSDVIKGYLHIKNDMEAKFFFSIDLKFTINNKNETIRNWYVGIDRGQLFTVPKYDIAN